MLIKKGIGIKMKSYTVKKTDDINMALLEYVNVFPWNYDYRPTTCFRVCHNEDSLIISLRSYEKNPVAHVTSTNGSVCNDSCMEFFFSPSEDNSLGYFNFEVNSNPTYLFEYRTHEGADHVNIEWNENEYMLSASFGEENGEPFWQIDFRLPFAMIKKYAPAAELSSGSVIRANVYKCGHTDQPDHYFCWNRVGTPGPNFHKPEFFGRFIFE